MRKLLLCMLPLALAGCQTWGPTWQRSDGSKWYAPERSFSRRPAIIERVDGESPLRTAIVKVEPGRRELTLRGTDPGWVDGGGRNNFVIDIQPCKRYYVNAQYTSKASPDWKPVVDYVWDIAGCKA